MRTLKKHRLIYLILIILVIAFSIFSLVQPSNDKNWADDQQVLPYAEIQDNIINIHNIRNFSYTSTKDYTKNYYDKEFDLNKIKNIYYIVEPFSGYKGAAHTFLSFEFEGDNFVAISVEIRKEVGESFSALKGLFKQYELMYVIGDEKDLIRLRSNYRKDLVYVYPIKTTKEKMKAVFIDMIERVNKLKAEPEFYNTFTSNCTTNIIDHVNKITPNKIPFSIEFLLPENSDRVAYELGLIDNALSFEKTREKYLINSKAEKYADAPDFSVKIREMSE